MKIDKAKIIFTWIPEKVKEGENALYKKLSEVSPGLDPDVTVGYVIGESDTIYLSDVLMTEEYEAGKAEMYSDRIGDIPFIVEMIEEEASKITSKKIVKSASHHIVEDISEFTSKVLELQEADVTYGYKPDTDSTKGIFIKW